MFKGGVRWIIDLKWVKLTERVNSVFLCVSVYFERFIASYTRGNYQTLKEIILAYSAYPRKNNKAA